MLSTGGRYDVSHGSIGNLERWRWNVRHKCSDLVMQCSMLSWCSQHAVGNRGPNSVLGINAAISVSIHRYHCRAERQTDICTNFSMAAVFHSLAKLFLLTYLIIWKLSHSRIVCVDNTWGAWEK